MDNTFFFSQSHFLPINFPIEIHTICDSQDKLNVFQRNRVTQNMICTVIQQNLTTNKNMSKQSEEK